MEIVEYTINNYVEDVISDIYKRKPDVLVFSCYIWNWNKVQEIFEEMHQLMPDLPIWLGGPEVSYDAEEILKKYPYLTGIMVGEGEETFRNLARHYVKGSIGLEKIAGIVTSEYDYKMQAIIPINTVPFLYTDLETFKNRIIYYESMRGCPFRCSYCMSSIDKTVRTRDLELVFLELQFFLDQKVSQVKFIDRTFNCVHDHAYAVWEYLHEHDNGITNFHFEIAATILNEKELTLLNKMRPGLVQLEIGVQTTNPKTIDEIDRVMDLDVLEKVVSRVQDGENIHQHLDLIAGLPYEDMESFKKSFDDVYRMHPEQLQLGFLKVLKGTKMHDNREEYGLVYRKKPPYEVLYTKWISFEELQELKQVEEMVELFYNSSQFTYSIRKLEEVFERPYDLYFAMAKYFDKKGYFLKNPARAYRYTIFYEFASEVDGKNKKVYAELLTHDMYLRENLKSRPDFMQMKLSIEEKDRLRAFYRVEEEEARYLINYKDYNSRQMAKMTHIEKYETMGAEVIYMLYDYQERNPLNHEAKTYRVEL
jgi:radical SAM superfamily enzyme YgiQ (UPF0313 family)